MQWIDFPDPRLPVSGLPWFQENCPELWRLPKRIKGDVRPPVWELAQQPSGGRIRFSTDATSIAIRLHYPDLNGMKNMHTVGQMGLDLYVDNEYWSTVFPVDEPDVEGVFCADAPARLKNICIYLPLYAPVQVKAVGMNDEASVWEPGPFAVRKPVVFYGTSITQGGCASRSGMSYQAILSRELLLDYVNLGFSGNGKGEQELAAAMAEIDASCYVVDFAQNSGTPAAMKKAYAPFLATLRDKRPSVPIICITPIFATSESFSPGAEQRNNEMRQIVRDAVAQRREAGDSSIGLVEGTRLLGPDDRDGLVDGTHPNDLGFQCMADGIGHAIFETLKPEQ